MQAVKEQTSQSRKAAQISVDVALQRHDVETLTGIGTEAQQQHLFDEGYKLVHHFLKGDASRSAVTGSPVYWKWWQIQWAQADYTFVSRVQYSDHFAGHSMEALAAIWLSTHSIEQQLEPEEITRQWLTNGFYSVIEGIKTP
jgi:hypothetical protein